MSFESKYQLKRHEMSHLQCNYCQMSFESKYHFKRHELTHKHRMNVETPEQKNILSYSNEELKTFLLEQFPSWKYYYIFNNGNWIAKDGVGTYPFLSSPTLIYALIQYRQENPSIYIKDIRKKLLENGVCNEINVPAVCTICEYLRKLGYIKSSSESWKNNTMEFCTPSPNISYVYPIENEEYFNVEEKPLDIDEIDPLFIDPLFIDEDIDVML